MIYLDVCSGISAASVAWKPLRWIGERIAAVEALLCLCLLLAGCAPKPQMAAAKSPLTFPPECRVFGCVTIWNQYGAGLHGAGVPWGLIHPKAQWWADRTSNRWAWISADGETRLMDLAPTATGECWITYGEVTITPTVLCASADVNCDGTTNTGDVLVVRAGRNWGKSPAAQVRADVNADGSVDGGDLLVIRAARNWNTITGSCECGPF